jgi:hypothetical protein
VLCVFPPDLSLFPVKQNATDSPDTITTTAERWTSTPQPSSVFHTKFAMRYTTTACGKTNVSGSTVRRMRKYGAHYVTGYLHNPVTDRLQSFDGRVIKNSLSYACKRVAQEMDGLAL